MKPKIKIIITTAIILVLLFVFGLWFIKNGSRPDTDDVLSNAFGDVYCGIFADLDDECIGRVDLSDSERLTVNGLADGTTVISSSDLGSGSVSFDISENQASFIGPQGPAGPTGPKGDIGITGAVGATGGTGLAGPQGEGGLTGAQGLRGIQGEAGLDGEQGVQGIQGAKGIQGDEGTQGTQGAQGIQGAQGAQSIQGAAGINGQSAGQLYWFQDAESNIANYESFLRVPGNGDEQDESTVNALSGEEYLIDAYITEPGVPGISQLPVGLWQFHTYTYVSGGSGNIVYRVFKRNIAGVETELFNATSASVINTSIAEVVTGYTYSGSVAMESTDRLVVKIYAKNTIGGESAHFTHDGTAHVSYAVTSLGLSGIVGAQGEQGIQGVQGIQGIQGAQGLKGDKGDTGAQGIQGIQGIQGLIGDTGAQGIQGLVGPTGPQGIQGIQGATGLTGSQGIQGIQGTVGATGAQGAQGPAGSYMASNGINITDDVLSVKLNGASLLNGTSGLSINLSGTNTWVGLQTFNGAKFGSDGVNFSQFEADGTLVFSGNATVWDDLRFPATSINPTGAEDPMTFDKVNFGFLAIHDATQSLAMIAQMPHGWKLGSDIYPHIHWGPSSVNTGNVLWRMQYKWTNLGDTDAGSFTTSDVLQAASGVVNRHQLVSFPVISGFGKTISSMLSIKISRVGGDPTDTYTGSSLLKEFDIHYEIDALGSRSELVK